MRSDLIDQCSRHDIPPAVRLLTKPTGHDLELGLIALADQVLPPAGSETSLPLASRSTPIRRTAKLSFSRSQQGFLTRRRPPEGSLGATSGRPTRTHRLDHRRETFAVPTRCRPKIGRWRMRLNLEVTPGSLSDTVPPASLRPRPLALARCTRPSSCRWVCIAIRIQGVAPIKRFERRTKRFEVSRNSDQKCEYGRKIENSDVASEIAQRDLCDEAPRSGPITSWPNSRIVSLAAKSVNQA